MVMAYCLSFGNFFGFVKDLNLVVLEQKLTWIENGNDSFCEHCFPSMNSNES